MKEHSPTPERNAEPSPDDSGSDLNDVAVASPITESKSSFGWALIFVEVVLIFGVFWFNGATPAPDVNESHYLTKAKHYWNPEYCPDDIFLGSAHAHLAFYWSIGWLTLFMSLPATAWVGRVVVWALTAFSWQRFSQSVLPIKLLSPLTAGLMLLLIRHNNLAGEWVIGGIEGKGFAYFFLFLAMADLIQERMKSVWIWLGLASAFHVLVGGWSVVMLLLVVAFRSERTVPILKMIPYAVIGFLIALLGIIPALALGEGAPPEVTAKAYHIYVMERISHHLVFSRFRPERLVLHGILFAIWVTLLFFSIQLKKVGRLQLFVIGAVVIAGMGIAIDQYSIVSGNQVFANKLLRFYWFRMLDVMIPIGVIFSSISLLRLKMPDSKMLAFGIILSGSLVVGGELYWLQNFRANDSRPRADQQALKMSEKQRDYTMASYEQWVQTCFWIRENTDEEAVFITPYAQQTFKWYAQRTEVANWKDIPQDAKGIVDWNARLFRIHPPSRPQMDILGYNDDELVELAKRYKATHLVVHRQFVGTRYRIGYPPKFKRLLPKKLDGSIFFVYEIRPKEE